ncbi:X2-like carbohydrate binding domain-containing protein [Cellulosilyticum sp. ST5]|uniref:X2-like carbohydrate binding domain-containing protein n=1 Tax=Cellulosilyticum sp. ST5 TaxID=3055805 RepID=UPI0039774DBF
MKKSISVILSLILTIFFSIPISVFAEAGMERSIGNQFVKANGNQFVLDGTPFYYAGTNNYYLNFKPNKAVDNVIEDASDMGLSVIRTWGHLDVGTPTGTLNDKGEMTFTNNVDGIGSKDGIYYQYFDTNLKKPVVNEGENGLQKLDYAIYKASQENVKLLITFTNNWEAFGGMAQYVKWAQLAGENVNGHDDFYTNAKIKEWYKAYVNTLLNRVNTYSGIKYKDDPTIFAWELANEPRATSDSGCKKNILLNWANEMSTYVKSIDSNHMVAVGDEGFYNFGYQEFPQGEYKYVYYGSEGADFNSLVRLPNIDFGTVHIYCDQWGLTSEQAKFWFKQHGEDAKAANKPVILEEFGWKDRNTRSQIYSDWFKVVEGATYPGITYAGTNYWMLASIMDDGSLYPDYDGYTVYYRGDSNGNPTQDTANLIMQHAQRMKAKNNGSIEDLAPTLNPTTINIEKGKAEAKSINVSYNNHQLIEVKNADKTLVKGTDYTVNDNQIILQPAYLNTLATGINNLSFNFDNEYMLSVAVVVNDGEVIEPQTPTIDKTSATVDLAKVEDLLITLMTNGNSLKGITAGGKTLVSGQDYAINGNQVRFNLSSLQTLQVGQIDITFVFETVVSPVLKLTVVNSNSTEDPTEGFVYAEGEKFYIDGEPFYFAGTNAYDLFTIGDSSSSSTIEDICNKYMYPREIEARIKEMADNGVKVIRTWGFSNESWHGFETAPGKYVEPQFMLFDYIMYCAKKYDVKVIITLENYWEAYGGINQKLQWAGLSDGSHKDKAQFFTNDKCKQWYKNYAEHFINRTNYFTGVKYKDDPTIFAWDLMNEPRYQDVSTTENTQGITLRKWVDEMAGYIKSLDPNHMVSVGIEGHETRYGFGSDEGNPFVYIQQSPYIDFCSAHPYPDEYWASLTPEQNADLMRTWIKDAHEVVGKPFVVGEFNVHSSLAYDKYEAYWRSVYDVIDEEGAAGGLFWEFNTRKLSDFTVMAGDPILNYFKAHSAKMTAKNTGTISVVNSITPSTVSFDKAVPTDVIVTVQSTGNATIQNITQAGNSLVEGNDYAYNNNQVTLKASYLAKQNVGEISLIFDMSEGNAPKLSISIKDTAIKNSEVLTKQITVDPTNIQDSAIEVSFNGNTLVAIKAGSQDLSTSAYEVSGNKVILKVSYLSTLASGNYEVELVFSQGDSSKVTITVLDAENPVPSAPTGLQAQSVTATSIEVEWSKATDGTVLKEYQVLVDNVLVGVSHTNTYIITNLTPATTYSITVKAVDLSNNVSVASEALNVTTQKQEESDEIYALPWKSGITYTGGEVVYYNGAYWKCQWYTVGQEPGSSPVWQSYTPGPNDKPVSIETPVPGVYPDWNASTIYTGGEIVYYANDYWKCKWWNQNTPPNTTVNGTPWDLYIKVKE